MRFAAKLLIFIFLVLLGSPAAGIGQELDRATREAIRKRLVDSGRYETQLPVRELPASRPRRRSLGSLAAFLLDVLVIVGIVIVVGALVLVVVVLLNRRADRKRLRAVAAESRVALTNVMIDVDLAEIEKLAQERRFSEAIHLLLLRTITELVRLARIDIRPAWTSREIATLIPLEDDPRGDLQDLVHRAELGHFAAFESTAADYSAARDVFERLVQRLKGKPE